MNIEEIWKNFKQLELEEDEIYLDDTEESRLLSNNITELSYDNISIDVQQQENKNDMYYLVVYIDIEDMGDETDTNNVSFIMSLLMLPHYIDYDGDNEIWKFPIGNKNEIEQKIKEINEKIKNR